MAIGNYALTSLVSGTSNIAIGGGALAGNNGSQNIAIGLGAAAVVTGANGNLFIGGNDGTGYETATNNIVISDGVGNVRIRSSSAGAVTAPAQPSFLATRSVDLTGYNPSSQTNPIVFNSETYDIGNNYNNATGLFTAPVTGNYIFSAGVYSASGVNVSQLWFVINGARERSFVLATPTDGGNLAGTGMVRLTAGQTIGIVGWFGGTTVTITANSFHTYFRGALIS
jgi:hypothetical protein